MHINGSSTKTPSASENLRIIPRYPPMFQSWWLHRQRPPPDPQFPDQHTMRSETRVAKTCTSSLCSSQDRGCQVWTTHQILQNYRKASILKQPLELLWQGLCPLSVNTSPTLQSWPQFCIFLIKNPKDVLYKVTNYRSLMLDRQVRNGDLQTCYHFTHHSHAQENQLVYFCHLLDPIQ